MKCIHVILASALFGFTELASAQGFVNLDFEGATIAPTPVGGATFPADPAQCFPGWTVGGGPAVSYNDLSLGAPEISLMGPNFPNGAGFTPLQGSYSVFLQYFNIGQPPTLSQTGLVPINTQSISFLVRPGENVADSTATMLMMNGVSIPLIPIGNNRVGGNISAFAGSVSQLTISTISSSDFIYFDDVQFSSSAIPEPSAFALLILGSLSLGFWHWRKSAR